MSALRRTLGRLLGGLPHIRRLERLSAFLREHRDVVERLAWNVAGGVIGCVCGLVGVTLWLRSQ